MPETLELTQTEKVLSAIDNLVAEHDRWENDPAAPEVPTQALDDAVTDCVTAIAGADIPHDCRTLANCLMDFCDLWLDYRNGEWDRKGRPFPKVWSAFTETRRARDTVREQEPRRVESVTQLRAQKVSDLLIAKAYGIKNPVTEQWEGVFFNSYGQVRNELIDQQHRYEEGKEKESPIPADWEHPQHKRIAQDGLGRLTQKLQSIEARTAATGKTQDKGTPESLALEGAFPHQVKKAFGLSQSEVEALYNRLGLPLDGPDLGPDLGTAPPEPQKQPEPPTATQDPADSCDDDALSQAVMQVHTADDSLGPAEIARQVEADHGITVGWQKVSAILKKQREGAAA